MKNVFVFGLFITSSCFFCNSFGENITHLSCDCTIAQCLWKKLQLKLNDDITLLPTKPQSAIFGFPEADCQSYLIQKPHSSHLETVHIQVQKK